MLDEIIVIVHYGNASKLVAHGRLIPKKMSLNKTNLNQAWMTLGLAGLPPLAVVAAQPAVGLHPRWVFDAFALFGPCWTRNV